MTSKRIGQLITASFLATLLLVIFVPGTIYTANVEQPRMGPKVDVWRLLTIKSPDEQLTAIRDTREIDFLPDLIRPADIEALGSTSPAHTITNAPGFHMGHVGFNLRLPVFDDAAFRHALLHGYPQEEIIASIYEYTVTPIRSLVPPAEAGWKNPAIPTHPFNHGDVDSPPGEESVFGILYAAGYEYHGTGYGDLTAYWTRPPEDGGGPIPEYVMWTPTTEVAPTSHEHGQRIADEWHRCGLNTLSAQGMDFNTYTGWVFDDQNFDFYMIFWGLGRFPDHLFDMLHSSQDVPGAYNAPGVHDDVMDPYLETLKYGFDHDAKMEAAFWVQDHLYDPANPWAFPYLQMYSRVYFNGFTPALGGIVNSMGYGSDNTWTLYMIHWDTVDGLRPETGDNMVIYCNGEEPASLSPLQASTVYEWNIITPTLTTLIEVDPFTHKDIPWVATDWDIVGPITETITLDSENRYLGLAAGETFDIVEGMKITYYLRDDVRWHDGNQYTAADAEFSIEFMRNNQIPRYTAAWQNVIDVQTNGDYEFTVYSDVTGQFFVYDWSALAVYLSPEVWSWTDGQPLPWLLGYPVWQNTTDTGPWPTPTQLIGIGPFVFQGYDEVGQVADCNRFDNWFKTTDELEAMWLDMFHGVGDCAPVPYDGLVDDADQTAMSYSFGYMTGEPEYNSHADIDNDGIVGGTDTSLLSFYFGRKRDETL